MCTDTKSLISIKANYSIGGMIVSEDVKIRSLSEDDLNAVVRIDKKVLGKERRDFWKRKIAYSDIYPRPALIAEVEGKVVGFILGYVSGWEFGVPDSVGWIDTVGVDPDYQQKGIGRLLFDALIEVFRSSGKEQVPGVAGDKRSEIEGVNVVYTLVSWDRIDLLHFYHSMGFKKGNVLNLQFEIR